MKCKYFFTLFLVLLGVTTLSICLMQPAILESMKAVVKSGYRTQPVEDIHIPKIGPVLSTNRSACYSEKAVLTRQYIPQSKMEDILQRRKEEYRQYQLRTKTDFDSIILAPANSPLQYPVTGVIVSPLIKTVIPGLAVYTQKRELFQVTLTVNNGVLSVEDVSDEKQVDGQGESKLTITSSNLKQLNDLLSRVTYTSTIYRIRSSDLVRFCFENSEAVFPIIIKRPTVPVLYNPGNDINMQVTITTKTFLRYKQLHVLIKSIRKLYPNIKIIIADDSLKPESVSGDNIEQYIMPPAKGWFAGRNLAVSQVTTKYFLWVDDDFVFLNETCIESFVEIMEAVPELDVLGGAVSGEQYYFNLQYSEGDEGGCLRRIKGAHHNPLPGFDGCVFVDVVVNFFLARTDAVRSVGFDPFLKRVGHTEFFIDGLGKLLVASCKHLSIGHQTYETQDEYDSYRKQSDTEQQRKLAHHFFKNYLKCIKY